VTLKLPRLEAAGGYAPSQPLNEQHLAMQLLIEGLLDDFIERGNGCELDDEWAKAREKDLFDARDNPRAFLHRCPRLPGSWLDLHYPLKTL
jgi:hypothetical protein